MASRPLHPWNLTPREAIALQKQLAGYVDKSRSLSRWQLIAGADVSYNRFSTTLYAAVVVLRAKDLSLVEAREASGEATFPYVPGLLTFREAPILLNLFAQLQNRPDVVMVDGQGIAHPRRFGIASHLGLVLGVPTVGCAKSLWIGEYDVPDNRAGASSKLLALPDSQSLGKTRVIIPRVRKETIGAVVRTKLNTKPLFVSVGHAINLRS